MKTTKTVLLAVLLMLVAHANTYGQSSSLPVEASVRQIVLTNLGGVRVNVAPAETSVYLFPSFGGVKRAVYYTEDSRFPSELIDNQGKSKAHLGLSKVTFELKVEDLLVTHRSQIIQAIQTSSDPSLRGKEIRQPDMLPECSALFEVRDDEAGGVFLGVGKPWQFTLDTGSYDQTFKFFLYPEVDNPDGDLGDLIEHASEDGLRLTIHCRYNAKFTKEDLRITGKFLEEQMRSIASDLSSSKSHTDILMFIPLGGDISSRTNVSSIFKRSISLVLEKREGATSQDLPPEDLVNRFVDRTFQSFERQVRLSDLEQSKVVSFMLSSGIRITLPIGKVTQISDYFAADTERRTSELFTNLNSSSSSQSSNNGIDIDIPDFAGGGFSGSAAYNQSTSSDQKQARDAFARDVQDMRRSVQGDFGTVTAMNVNQVQHLGSSGSFSTLLEANQYREGQKDLILRFTLDRFASSTY